MLEVRISRPSLTSTEAAESDRRKTRRVHRDLVPEAAVMLSDPQPKEKPSATRHVLVISAKNVT